MNTFRQIGPSPMSRQTSSPLVADNKPTDVRATRGTGQRSAAAGTVTRAAIESLILKNYTGLRLLILRRVGDAQVAADLLSEAICITWEKWQANQIERPDQIAGYIFQVAVNLLRNHRRSIGNDSRRHVDSRQIDEIPDEECVSGQVDRAGDCGQGETSDSKHEYAAGSRHTHAVLPAGRGQAVDLPRS